MVKILNLLKGKLAVQSAVVAALCAVIWFAGPMITIGDKTPLHPIMNRLLAIMFVMVASLVYNLIKQAISSKKDQQLIAQISESQDDPERAAVEEAQSEELTILRQKFEQALLLLKKTQSKKKHNKQYLYELPWYVIIGAPGSGKTTLLMNSGLHFPLSDTLGEGPVEGVGGTRNCDWLFTNDAIFLDTAGRYATQDSHQSIDKAAWGSFLNLIKKNRPLRPINGVLVTISIPDLICQTPEERSRQAKSIRQRINELYEVLGSQFPIYLLITKCDLVAGFNDFFSDMGLEERSQVWGETFPFDDPEQTGNHIVTFDSNFDGLLSRLNQRTIRRIQEEPDIERRSNILNFPQEMALLKPAVMSFLKETFAISRFESLPLLRGVYFTSGTQEGTPIDRVMGLLSDAYGLDRQNVPIFSGQGKSFFLTRLLKNVIFSEAELSGVNKRTERLRNWFYLAACSVMIFLLVGMTVLWTVSYIRNKRAIRQAHEIVKQYQVDFEDIEGRDNNFIRSLLFRIGFFNKVDDVYKEPSSLMGFGLYQGDKIRSGVQFAYDATYRDSFRPYIISLLEQWIYDNIRGFRDGGIDNLNDLAKVYIMLGNPEKTNADLMIKVMGKEWTRLFPREPHLHVELDDLMRKNLEGLQSGVRLNQGIVTAALDKLSNMPMAVQLYNDIKSNAVSEFSDFEISQKLGVYGDRVFLTYDGKNLDKIRIPGLFTYNGFQDFFKNKGLSDIQQLYEENWVLKNLEVAGHRIDWSRLYDDVQKLYFEEYKNHWRTLIDTIRIKKTQGIYQTIEMLDYLSGSDSPLRFLLQVIEHNTVLSGDDVPDPLGLVKNLEYQFRELNRLVQSSDKSPAPLDMTIQHLNAVREYMMQIGSAVQSEEQALAILRKRIQTAGAGDAVKTAENEFTRLPEPVNHWLMPMVSFSLKQTIDTARSGLNNLWKNEVRAYYLAGLHDRYPLFNHSSNDATMDDFCRFFSANGIIHKFFQDHLKPFVDTSKSQWRQVTMDSHSVVLAPSTLRQFQRAEKIRKMFFSSGGSTPSVKFGIKPVDLDERIDTFRLNIEGQTAEYRHGPTITQRFQWPSPQETSGVRLTLRTLKGREMNISWEGPWALFRMLDDAVVENAGTAERFIVTFHVEGFSAKFELMAYSVYNPFGRESLQRFRCPESL